MTVNALLLEELAAVYDENGWFVTVHNAVRDLSAERAAWKGPGHDHAIWEIVAHLNFYNDRYLRRFKGERVDSMAGHNTSTFSMPLDPTDEAWNEEVARLVAILSGWRSFLREAEEPSTTEAEQRIAVIAHMLLHLAHHGGQIVLIRKLQGSWDPSAGVS